MGSYNSNLKEVRKFSNKNTFISKQFSYFYFLFHNIFKINFCVYLNNIEPELHTLFNHNQN